MRYILFLMLFLHSFAHTEEESPQLSVLSTAEELASTHRDHLIGGLVSPISGQLILQETDLIAQGAQDVSLTRRYLPPYMPCSLSEKPLWEEYNFANYLRMHYRGWSVVPHQRLQEYTNGIIRVTEPTGATLDFLVTEGKTKLVSSPVGLSNASEDMPSGRYDLRNTRIAIDKENQTITIFAADGTERLYKFYYSVQKVGRTYLLHKEILPNGKVLKYSYRQGQLEKIESLDPQERHTYASIRKIDHGHNRHYLSHTDRVATYRYEVEKRKIEVKDKHRSFSEPRWAFPPLLKGVDSPFYAEETLEYCPRYLLGIQRGKENSFGVFHQGYGTPEHYRVHRLEFPVGENGSLEAVYEIDYQVAIPEVKGGITVAKDRDGNRVRYHISKEMLVTRIEFFDAKNRLKKEKIYTWGNGSNFFTQHEKQWLFAVETKDGAGNLLLKKSFAFDPFGNPKEETISGDLTGSGEIESFTIYRTFSTDGKHLLLKEEQGEKSVTFHYLPGTDLPVKKLTRDAEKIWLRAFWEYDDSYNLIKTITDDGTNEDKDNLIGVTERKITVFHLKQEAPHLHRPILIEEKYLEESSEKLLNCTHLEYDGEGNVAVQSVEDPDGKLLYTVKKEYNQQNLPLVETNALGFSALSTYDSKGHLKTYQNAAGNLLENSEYDARGRLIEKKEIPSTGEERIHTYVYDFYDHLKERHDYLGSLTRCNYDFPSHQVKRIEEPLICDQPVISRYSYSALGHALSHTTPDGYTTLYRHNAYGSVTEALYPDKSKETWRYDKQGRLVRYTNPDNVTTIYTHDLLDRVRTKTILFPK